jgi:bifunctional UDP-N-acetylglucosamine pyrophosphorylase/glucosamine-1-phosphate N-acetyltransferase
MDQGVTILDPQSTFIDETVVIGQDTIIHPFTMIEGEVSIGRNCVIGPFAHIRTKSTLRDGVEIGNFVEVKASQVGEYTKAKHLSYLGDAVVGQNVNIGAGTITANYDGKKKHVTHIEDGAFIGSGTIMVAPVCIGKEAVTGAGSVVTRGKDVPQGATVVGVPARKFKKNQKAKDQEQ